MPGMEQILDNFTCIMPFFIYGNSLDNKYYKVIIDETWRQRDPGGGKFQWDSVVNGGGRPPPPGRRRKRDAAQVRILSRRINFSWFSQLTLTMYR